MATRDRPSRTGAPRGRRIQICAAAGAALLALAALVARSADPAGPGREAGVTPGDAKSSAGVRTAAPRADGASERPAGALPPRDDGQPEGGRPTDGAPGVSGAPEGEPLVPVDLAALREKMPDNLYWQLGAPTEDPESLARREEEAARMNELFGKVQSGTASEEEIDRYHERRRRISEDYIAFASAVLTEHAADLSDRDRGLLELGVRMHEARLAELPRRLEEAHARRKLQAERRAAWHAASAGHTRPQHP